MKGVVTVDQGRVRGVEHDGLWRFAGIPYGRAPVGDLRWRLPVPVDAWEGVRDASSFGPIGPQNPPFGAATSPGSIDPVETQSEDCLSLNVWTPELPGATTSGSRYGRPVMVFIHGGAFTSGSGSMELYHGTHLVRNGDVVVVTINYRLGALGFLGHRALSDEGGPIGNWGIGDQIAALRWVRDNIGAFGGDPDRVTVFGESAGGFSVATLLGTPAAAGLFRRAVVQSGGVHVHTVENAERSAERLVAVLGLAHCDREALQGVPAADLVAATEELRLRHPEPGMIPLPFLPVVDGALLPLHPLSAIENGSADGVDLLVGTNRDELTVFSLTDPALATLDETGLTRWVARAAPEMYADEVIGVYRQARSAWAEPIGAKDIWVAVGTDLVFRWPSLQLAAAHAARGWRAFVYLFEWESPAFGGILGACHALELPFVFGAVHEPHVQVFTGAGPEVEALSAQMQRAWLAFATGGSPGHEDIGTWHPWDTRRRATMVFGPRTALADAPRDSELSLLERHRPLDRTGGGRAFVGQDGVPGA